MLIQAALEDQPGSFTLLGGSLEDTFWGDPLVARELFAWLAAHPWIDVHNLETLSRAALPLEPVEDPADAPQPAAGTLEKFPEADWAGDNPIGDAALDLWFRSQPDQTCLKAGDARLDDFWMECGANTIIMRDGLKTLAAGSARMLAFASRWAQETACTDRMAFEQASQIDVDGDGLLEVVLTSDRLLAVIDSQAGRLAGLFGCRPGHSSTIILSPRATTGIGMSDPSTWHLDRGEIGEWSLPLLDGGFVSSLDAGQLFDLALTPSGVLATHPRGDYQLHYTLKGSELEISLTGASTDARMFELPFNLSPERLQQPGFLQDLSLERQPNGFQLGPRSGTRIAVQVDADSWLVDSFLDSNAPAMDSEDPNEETPLGHFLPIPFTLMTFDLGQGQRLTVHIQLLE